MVLPHSGSIPYTPIKLAAKLGRMCKVQCTQHAPAIHHTCHSSSDVLSIPPNSPHFNQLQLSQTLDCVCHISIAHLIQEARDEITNHYPSLRLHVNHTLRPHQSNRLPWDKKS